MGVMAEESDTRALAYERVGCNVIGTKKDRSTPLAFWTNQDVLQYILNEGMEICSVYGQIIEDHETGELKTTGVSRTGCIWCLFGIQFDHKRGKLNRIQMLAATHPQLHKYATKTLGIGAVMDYLGFPWAIPEAAPSAPPLFPDELAL
jgi:3'-phosphoadenosine 5'-phosphosulfate sulfotransferase (PAPS reductase)/FAD synthetase